MRQVAYQVEEGADVELSGVGQVGEPNAGNERADLAGGGGDAVARGADVRGEHLAGQQPGGRVGAELPKEGAQEVQGLQHPPAQLEISLGVCCWHSTDASVHGDAVTRLDSRKCNVGKSMHG